MKVALIFFALVAATCAAPNKDVRDTSPTCPPGEYLSIQTPEYQFGQTGLYDSVGASCDLSSTSYGTIGITSAYTTYLYFHTSYRWWMAGSNSPNTCSTLVGAYGTGGDESSPLTVTSWNEFDGTTWHTDTTYTVVCIVPPCDTEVLISGSTCEDPLEGLYDLAPEANWCSARPSFQMGSYVITFNMTYQVWVIGAEPCTTMANIAAYPTLVNYPYDYTGLWADPCFGSFMTNAAYKVLPSCPARDSHHPKQRRHNHIDSYIHAAEALNVQKSKESQKDMPLPIRPISGPLPPPPRQHKYQHRMKPVDQHQPGLFAPNV